MAIPSTSLSTNGIPPRLRTQFWSESLRRLFGNLNVDPFGSGTLEGHIECFQLSRLRLYRLEGTPIHVEVLQSAGQADHPSYRILCHVQGTAIFEQGGQRFECGPGDCLIYDQAQPHSITNLTQTRVHAVGIPAEFIRKRRLSLDNIPALRLAADPTSPIVQQFLHSVLSASATLPADAAAGIEDALLHLLLTQFRPDAAVPTQSHSDSLRCRAEAFIATQLHNPELDVGYICTALGCSKRYLHLVFQEQGTSVARYIWQSRIERCRQELESARPGRSITQVAFSWGFSSSAHFSRVFKEHVGLSPTEFKQRHAGPFSVRKN